ncbi:MAG: hypothetical protein HC851_10935 [Acaryochloris sp. RU_4_1]|nr:hypothetical protein [Acaryochloris sp. RU_4_1]NJN38045.1 hypothetical protein [Acaryochloridaceae cyanobacterium CSU_3_4]NJR54288.1 hypothetical protein [Acaryochloris sp. CRU_2_0]
MECKLCGHNKTYKHGTMPNGHQRYRCLECKQTVSESFDSLRLGCSPPPLLHLVIVCREPCHPWL